MYGSNRRKHTCIVHNIKHLQNLEARCDDNHSHEPWGLAPTGWATAEETAYPWPLCRKIATLLALQAQNIGVSCSVPTFAVHTTQLEQIRQQTFSQNHVGLPWVSEFETVREIPTTDPIPANSRLLSTPVVEKIASAGNKTIRIHRSPENSVKAALELGHPGLSQNMLPEPMQESASFTAD